MVEQGGAGVVYRIVTADGAAVGQLEREVVVDVQRAGFVIVHAGADSVATVAGEDREGLRGAAQVFPPPGAGGRPDVPGGVVDPEGAAGFERQGELCLVLHPVFRIGLAGGFSHLGTDEADTRLGVVDQLELAFFQPQVGAVLEADVGADGILVAGGDEVFLVDLVELVAEDLDGVVLRDFGCGVFRRLVVVVELQAGAVGTAGDVVAVGEDIVRRLQLAAHGDIEAEDAGAVLEGRGVQPECLDGDAVGVVVAEGVGLRAAVAEGVARGFAVLHVGAHVEGD